MKLNIGLPEKTCEQIAQHLNDVLANEFALYTKSLNFHWNIKGPDFDALHAFFRRIYEQLFDIVDDVAERVQTMGGTALGSLQEFKERATIKDHPSKEFLDQMAMIRQLLFDHELVIKQLREAIELIENQLHDKGTGNFLTDIMEKHEKTAWMLRSFLKD